MICECYAPKCGDVLKSWIVPVLDALEVGLCIFPWSGIGILFLVSSMYLQIQNESMRRGGKCSKIYEASEEPVLSSYVYCYSCSLGLRECGVLNCLLSSIDCCFHDDRVSFCILFFPCRFVPFALSKLHGTC